MTSSAGSSAQAPFARGRLRALRLRSHRIAAPAPTLADAADHMLAVQSQEFWGGRWALAARTRGRPTITDVDALFDAGHLVRSWTMRGTLHIVPARDLDWILRATGPRQLRSDAGRLRQLGLDGPVLARAERVLADALHGGGRLGRTELFALLDAAGVDTSGQRGYHVLFALSVRGVLCQGPVVHRDAIAREQSFVLAGEWITDAAPVADPHAELFVRYIDGHGPAGAADFSWWSGLSLTVARAAAEASAARLREVDDGVFAAASVPRRAPSAPPVFALPSFEEYLISYADRSLVVARDVLAQVSRGANGMIRPVLVANGEVVGTWTRSVAAGRHRDDPVPDLLVPGGATDAETTAALERYRAFITG